MSPDISVTLGTPASIALKDVATIILAAASLATSGLVAAWNFRKDSVGKVLASQAQFSDAVLHLIQTRTRLEEMRRENGERWSSTDFRGQRGHLGDERQYHIAQALSALRVRGVSASPLEHSTLAAGLMDLGRTAEALQQFGIAREVAKVESDLLQVKRQEARANFMSGRLPEGRVLFQQVVDDYQRLSESKDYNAGLMVEACCETYRRWAELELAPGGSIQEAESATYAMFSQMERLNGQARQIAEANLAQLQAWLGGAKPKTPDVPPSPLGAS